MRGKKQKKQRAAALIFILTKRLGDANGARFSSGRRNTSAELWTAKKKINKNNTYYTSSCGGITKTVKVLRVKTRVDRKKRTVKLFHFFFFKALGTFLGVFLSRIECKNTYPLCAEPKRRP